MIYPLMGARLHGWLDDLVTALYLVAAFALRFQGFGLAVLAAAAALHFTITRITDYPQGQLKLIRFRTHAWIELAEGLALVGAGMLPLADGLQRSFLVFAGASQIGIAFALTDYQGGG